MKINWKVRFKHKQFWLAIISLILVLTNQVATLFNYDITFISEQIQKIAETILMIFIILGVIVDPTTDGMSDSRQALKYNKPRNDK